MTGKGADIPIVGIGASAGGLEALRELVSAIPNDSGFAYVIVQHLSANHPTMMADLLSAHTPLVVQQVEPGEKVAPDRVYLISPGTRLTLKDGCFVVDDVDREATTLRTPIDDFFLSLAEQVGWNAFCVILSGTGSDGTMGLKAVKAAGGVAIVQESDSARFPGMPDSAVATGLVDFVLRPDKIPGRLIDILAHRDRLHEGDRRDALLTTIEAHLPAITEMLAEGDDEGGAAHDFSGYKPGTLVRRIERRMALLRQRTVDGFVERLREDPDERQRLQQDFLIGVTRFFRDPDAFQALASGPIHELFAQNPSRVRVWVPGCSTGEEVYSLAILLVEARQRAGLDTLIQVFGTDIDTASLYHARQGVYAPGTLDNLSEDRLRTHFAAGTAGYVANQMLREVCIFAPHNVIQDPPFSRLDLISCRNMLIYLGTEAQATVLPRFHYALNAGGTLFLGPSESLGRHDRLFTPIDKSQRIFRRNDAASHGYSALTHAPPRARSAERRIPQIEARVEDRPLPIDAQAEKVFLERFAAPHAVVNERNEVVFLSERMTQFVQPRKGETSTQLDAFLVPPLRLPVRAALADLRAGRTPNAQNVVLGEGEERRVVAVEVGPMQSTQAMIVLRPLAQPDETVLEAAESRQAFPERARLEQELITARQQLDVTLSEYELSGQELRSTNEELLSMNEELQSANEELETSREELQSVNEELETMNAELSENNKQLQRANSDLKNLFESAEIATLFLDSQLCVRGFTPQTSALFGIRQRDIGRPLADLAQRFSYDTLIEDAEEVRTSLQTMESEVRVEPTDQTFIMRMRPYRTVDDRLDGFVLTFFDITDRKRYERQLERNREDLARQYAELESLYDTTPIGLSLMDRDLRWLRINERLAEINGFPVEAHIGVRQSDLIPDIDQAVKDAQSRVFSTGEPVLGYEVHGTTPAEPDRPRDWIVDYYPVFNGDEVFAVGCCVQEVTAQKELSRQLEANLSRLEVAVNQHPISMQEIDADGRLVWTLGDHPSMTKVADVGKRFLKSIPDAISEQLGEAVEDVLASGEPSRVDIILDASRTTTILGDANEAFDVSLEPLTNNDGTTRGLILLWFDITERKDAENRRVLLLGELQHRVKNTLATILAIVRFAAERAETVADMERALSERLLAISRTHDLLTNAAWAPISISVIFEDEVAPYADNARQVIDDTGLDIELSPRVALAIAMALHELVTNSVKHGALSDGVGSITVALKEEDRHMTFTWDERGRDATPGEPKRSGFGTFLLENALAYQLRGDADLSLTSEGVRFTLSFSKDVS